MRSSSPVELGHQRPVAPVWWLAEGNQARLLELGGQIM